MVHLLKKSLVDFRASYKKLLIFEYLFMLLTSGILIPVITYIFNRILMVIGSGSLLNNEVYQLSKSYQGIIGLVFIGLLASFTLFVELCVLVIMIQQRYFGKTITISDALLTTLIKTPRLIGFGFVQFMVFLLLLIPFIDSPFSKSFYSLFNLPIFLQNKVIDASFTLSIIYVLLVLILLYTIIRWIFVLHYIMLEDKTITEAIRSSQILTNRRRFRLFILLIGINGGIILGSLLITTAISYLPVWLNIDLLVAFSTHHSLTISTILTYMVALLVMPLNLIFITRLFYYYSYREGHKPYDKAYIYRSSIGRLEQHLTNLLQHLTATRLLKVGTIVIYIGLALYIGIKATDNLVFAKWNMMISAHRGDTEQFPENSIPAINAALEKGYQSIEIDVQLTKDSVVVLHHDPTLLRMTGSSQRIADLTMDELSHYIIGYDSNGEPVHIPLLTEVLATTQGRAKLIIDLKGYGLSERLVDEVVRQVQAFNMEQEVYIQSFNQGELMRVRSLSSEIKVGQILYFALGNLERLDVDFYTIEQTMLTEQIVKQAHANGREIWVWTVNSSKNMKEVLKFHVDGIITDYPARAQSIIDLDL